MKNFRSAIHIDDNPRQFGKTSIHFISKLTHCRIGTLAHYHIMKHLLPTLLLFATFSANAQNYQPTWESLDSRPTPEWFQDAKFGVFICWGLYSVPAWSPVGQYAEWYQFWLQENRHDGQVADFHHLTYGEDFAFKDFAPMFKAELYQPDEWADLFERAGAKYIVFTTKHHSGYTMWPSAEAENTYGVNYNPTKVGPMRDLTGDIVQAVRKKGIKAGLYYSLYEWYHPWYRNDLPRFVDEHFHPQFKDLVTRYSPDIIWTDGEWEQSSATWKSEELLAWVFNETPNKEVVINDRWGNDCRHKHGGFYTTEYGSGMDDDSHAWEESRGMGHSYGYNRAEKLEDYKSAQELILMLVDLVSRGGNLCLDIGPKADGSIPVIMEERLLQIGQWLKVNGEAIYGTRMWEIPFQWSDGELPENKRGTYMTGFNILKETIDPEPGQAVKEAFFTTKDGAVYAMIPDLLKKQLIVRDFIELYQEYEQLELIDVSKFQVTALEDLKPLPFQVVDGDLSVELGHTSAPLCKNGPWVIKIVLKE